MTCDHAWGGVAIPGPVNRVVIDQCENCGELRLPDAARPPVGEVSVKKEDANNYCLILRALGMEEEGDPVAEVKALIGARDRQPVGQLTDAEIDARLNALYRKMVSSGQHNGGMSGVAWDRAVYRMASNQPSGNPGELTIDGARQPVGEPVEFVRDLLPQEVLSAISAVAVIAKKECAHPVQNYIDCIDAWLFAAPTRGAK